MPGTTPERPGWYPDDDGGERWYDGNAWTEHRRGTDLGESTIVVPPSNDPQPPSSWQQFGAPAQLEVAGGRGLQIGLVVAGVVVLMLVGVVGGIVLLGGNDKGDKGDEGDRGADQTSPATSQTAPTDAASSLDVPTIDPSDFPTDRPTGPPTDVPFPDLPDLPTSLPSDFPDLPSDFPTDPADLESWFSDYLEQMNP